jgi:hypothetical protein
VRACCSLVCHSMGYSGKPGRRAGGLTLLHHLQHGVGRLWGRAGGEEEVGSRWGCVCVWDGMNGCCPQPAVQGRMPLLLPVQMLLQYSCNCTCMPALFTQVIDGPKPTTGSCGFDGESVHLVQGQWPSPSRCTCIPGYTDPIFTRDMTWLPVIAGQHLMLDLPEAAPLEHPDAFHASPGACLKLK